MWGARGYASNAVKTTGKPDRNGEKEKGEHVGGFAVFTLEPEVFRSSVEDRSYGGLVKGMLEDHTYRSSGDLASGVEVVNRLVDAATKGAERVGA